jgi:hypothetical protein
VRRELEDPPSTALPQLPTRAPFASAASQHSSAFVSIRQHTSAYVSIRQRLSQVLREQVDAIKQSAISVCGLKLVQCMRP